MRTIIAIALLAASLTAGCAISSSTSEPLTPAPTLAPGERPTHVIPVNGSVGDAPLTVRLYDRSLAVEEVRTATKQELADLEPLDANEVGVAQTVKGTVILTWQGNACPGGTADLFVSAGVTDIVVVPDDTSCAAGQSARGIVLFFNPQVDTKRVSFSIVQAPSV